jgi:DNA replication protein DnaC
MLNQPTITKLHDLRLAAMAEAWATQQQDPGMASATFDERFAMLVDAEHIARENRRIQRNLKQANLRLTDACIEDVQASAALDRATIRQLGTCAWVHNHINVLVSGKTGVGKSYLACALGQAACRKGYRVGYHRLPRLLEELALARADGTYAKMLSGLQKQDVLILDDLGLAPPKAGQKHDLLEVLEDRYGRTSTVITSQLPIAKWHEWIGEPTLADAILDRVVHNAYKYDLKGESKRKNAKTNA